MTGIEESISIDQVLASVKGQLGIMGMSQFDTLLEVWINEAVRQTHSGQLITIKSTTLTLENGKASLPSYRSIIGLRFKSSFVNTYEISGFNVTTTFRGTGVPSNSLGNNNDTYVRTQAPFTYYVKTAGVWVATVLTGISSNSACGRILFYDPETASSCGCDPLNSSFGQYAYIRGGEIFIHNIPNDAIEVELFYKTIATDKDCLYVIRPDFERACCAYARMRFYEAFPEIKGERLSINNGAKAQEEWINQAGMLRGVAARKNWDENKHEISMILRCWFSRESNY